MVLLWMILLEVLLCAEAEKVTEVRGQLGAEVTLTCSHQGTDTYWYMEIHSQLRASIGRSLSSVPSYSSADFETKFSILGTKLVIKNLTAEDCRLYFCGIRRDGSIQVVDTFHLVSVQLHQATESPESSGVSKDGSHDQKCVCNTSHTCGPLQSDPVIFSSLSLNAVLASVVICLSCVSASLKRRISKNQTDVPPAETSPEPPQYEEIQLPPRPATPPKGCIYYKAQLPHATLHQR